MKTWLKIFLICLMPILGNTSMNAACEGCFQSHINQSNKNCVSAFVETDCTCSRMNAKDINRDNQNISNHYNAIEIGEKLTSQNSINQLRLRKGINLSDFFKSVMAQLSSRDNLLVQDKSKIYYSSINHNLLPSCQYFVFALRHIII